MNKLKHILDVYKKDLLKDQLSKDEIHTKFLSNLEIKGSPSTILFFAAIIASIGLNINSLIIILGAKLISPIMGMIFSMGYGVSVFDFNIFKKALKKIACQVLIILCASTLYFLISPMKIPSQLLINSTNVSIFDILIALFAGACGIIATTRIEKNNVLPGIALATSLLPPICTVGYGISRLDITFIIGPIYLFLINVFFIMLSTVIFCQMFDLEKENESTKHDLIIVSRNLVTVAILLSIPIAMPALKYSFSNYLDIKISQSVQDFIDSELNFDASRYIETTIDEENKVIKVFSLGEHITDEEYANMTEKAYKYGLEGYDIVIVQANNN